jgi:hypothetical protein
MAAARSASNRRSDRSRRQIALGEVIPMLRYLSLALCFVLGSAALGAANK